VLTGDDPVPIGAPIAVDDAEDADAMGLQPVALATGATEPVSGIHGILVYEHKGADGWAGDDQFLTTYSDKDTAPVGRAVQLTSGSEVKVCFRNTEDTTFLNTRDYAGRVMVAGLGATPTLAVGDFLTPGTGDDDAGYWTATATRAEAWLVVTKVDAARQEVEARFVY
jgi:hypothetical protein